MKAQILLNIRSVVVTTYCQVTPLLWSESIHRSIIHALVLWTLDSPPTVTQLQKESEVG